MKDRSEIEKLALKEFPNTGDSKTHRCKRIGFISGYTTRDKEAEEEAKPVTKEQVISVLNKRLNDAFNNEFHKHEYRTLSGAIYAIQNLVPPEYFLTLYREQKGKEGGEWRLR